MAVLPQEMVTRVARAYAAGQIWLQSQGIQDEESVDVALAAASLRWFWKPREVNTLLLTNLRDFTETAELNFRVKSNWLTIDGDSPPDAFIRMPYCIGYGEPELVPGLSPDKNRAPHSTWQTLADLTQREHLIVDAPLLDRLEWKVRTLKELRSRGIWMLDATMHAGRTDRGLIQIWWERIGSLIYEEEHKPLIVTYGRGLYDDLLAVGAPAADFLYHPQGLASPSQRDHQQAAVDHIRRLTPNPSA
ncbi:hypothetical protein QPK87_13740 [Kamptonema cortianum]|nr:hypothetical protein [Geitlerinema splendidum]MDK3157630.1 hypothetical protein [Kamptonema cortianum]